MENGLNYVNTEIITVGREEESCVDSASGADVIARAVERAGAVEKSRYYLPGRPDEVVEAIKESLARYDLTIITGSSTEFPYLAARAAAKALGVEAVKNVAIFRNMQIYARNHGVELDSEAETMCLVPDGAAALECDKVPVCGYFYSRNGTSLVVLPGCSENISIMCELSLPSVFSDLKPVGESSRRINLVGCKIPDAIAEAKRVSALAPSLRAEVFQPAAEAVIELTAPGVSPSNAFKMIDSAERAIRSGPLGDKVYGVDCTMQEAVVRKLAAEHSTLSTAESCTGGLVAKLITDVPGASDVFPGGVVSYSNEIKYSILGVDEEILALHGAVSHQCAVKMAEGVRRVMGTSWGIGITGIAGPGGGSPEKPVGLVYVAIASKHRTLVSKYNISGDRETVRSTVAKYALRELLLRLLKRESK